MEKSLEKKAQYSPVGDLAIDLGNQTRERPNIRCEALLCGDSVPSERVYAGKYGGRYCSRQCCEGN